MKVLVIPDVHLKPWMFESATEIMKYNPDINQAVCLGDIADDFGKQHDIQLYEETYDAAIKFSKKFPETLWCYGNHDKSYTWQAPESGYSIIAQPTVVKKLKELELVASRPHVRYVHLVDNVMFLHGGLTTEFVNEHVRAKFRKDPEMVVQIINSLDRNEMWKDNSPIWYRPHYSSLQMYKPRSILQVVGHTPVRSINKDRSIISCDTFSTCIDGTPYGDQHFLLIDTTTHEFWSVKGF